METYNTLDHHSDKQEPAIRLTGVSKLLPSGGKMLTILDDINLEVPHGQFLAVLGPSGSGKSTLLGLLAGLDRPTEGSIEIDGTAIEHRSEDALALLRREKIGFVFQSYQLLANLTARENVMLPLELTEKPDARMRAETLLTAVGLDERMHHYPAQLSGGEQQRVGLARAFAAEPPVLLADEPTGKLDTKTGQTVLKTLESLRNDHETTVVLVTHDSTVAALADRRIYLRDGRVEREEYSDQAGGEQDAVDESTDEPQSIEAVS